MSDRHLDTGTEELVAQVRDGVAILTLNRPQARNALSDRLTPALRAAIAACDSDPEVGALLITGSGGAFCAGGDVKDMGSSTPPARTSQQARISDLVQRQRALTGALVQSRKPSIAALPGPAAGAGLSLALACDLRLAAASAFVRTAYVRIGLPGDYGISWLLVRAVGPARARELMLLSEDLDAERCHQLGLVNRVLPDDELQTAAFALAARLAAGPRQAIGLIKSNLDDATRLDFLGSLDGEAVRMIAHGGSAETREAIRAFLERRSPNFEGTRAAGPVGSGRFWLLDHISA
ncbi:enoyl-CoA hydratase-related protein [Caulobacter sp. KR2-114]|jgi:enoyl-CoA hydratase/carnithine racemase|uniref:enoyl-CoA hydratase-related protein n=1 Tax=Caulobacter sp. KR2-114 TaxID=3400912 RepID=UPI003C124AD2